MTTNKEPTVSEMLANVDSELVKAGCLPESQTLEEMFDYADVLEDDEYDETPQVRYLM